MKEPFTSQDLNILIQDHLDTISSEDVYYFVHLNKRIQDHRETKKEIIYNTAQDIFKAMKVVIPQCKKNIQEFEKPDDMEEGLTEIIMKYLEEQKSDLLYTLANNGDKEDGITPKDTIQYLVSMLFEELIPNEESTDSGIYLT